MDRNVSSGHGIIDIIKVALRKESVDRNPLDDVTHWGPVVVALRKESVDRNA